MTRGSYVKRTSVLLLMLVLTLTIAGCSYRYERVSRVELPDALYDELFPLQNEPGAVIRVDPETDDAYLQISVGEELSATQHLKVSDVKYNRPEKTLHIDVEQYIPPPGQSQRAPPVTRIDSNDWVLLLRFKRHNFDSIVVTVNVPGAPEKQVTYQFDRPFGQ